MELEYGSPQFRRVALGIVLASIEECGYKGFRKLELVHWASEALATKTIDELEDLYNNYAKNNFK